MSASTDGSIYLITGPMAAGKSTVARLLAERCHLGVHLEGDVFRRSIVSGRVEMTPQAPLGAVEQLRLRYRLAVEAAQHYAAHGFTVALDDVVAAEMLPEFVDSVEHRPLYLAVLLPSEDSLIAREGGRAAVVYGGWSVAEFHAVFATQTPRIGLWLDTTDQTAEETVDEIVTRKSEAALP